MHTLLNTVPAALGGHQSCRMGVDAKGGAYGKKPFGPIRSAIRPPEVIGQWRRTAEICMLKANLGDVRQPESPLPRRVGRSTSVKNREQRTHSSARLAPHCRQGSASKSQSTYMSRTFLVTEVSPIVSPSVLSSRGSIRRIRVGACKAGLGASENRLNLSQRHQQLSSSLRLAALRCFKLSVGTMNGPLPACLSSSSPSSSDANQSFPSLGYSWISQSSLRCSGWR